MRTNPVRLALEWMLIVSLLLSVIFFYRYLNQSRELRTLQVQVQQALFLSQNNHNVLNLLLTECQDYGKAHPDIRPLLEMPKPQVTPAAAPAAAKPAGK